MRILFIHNHYEYAGGEDIAVNTEVAFLLAKGHKVEILRFFNKEIRNHFLPAINGLKAVYNVSSKRIIKEKIESFAPEVIHVHNLFFMVSPSVFFVATKLNIPIILTLHNYRLICCNALLLRNHQVCEICVSKKLPFAGIKYRCYRSSSVQSAMVTAITGIHKIIGTWKNKIDTFIALTEFAKTRFLNSSLDLSDDRVEVIPNFVPDEGGGFLPREDFFLFVGRLSIEKGLFTLLEALSDLPAENVIIAGEGPEEGNLKKCYERFENIKFQGQLSKSQIIALMKKCKALIFPSIWFEGLPFTIIEAFSTGTPVISSRLGAMAEMIEDSVNGFHFEANNVGGLKNAINKFNGLNDTERQKIYSQARLTYEEKYHPEAHYKNIMSVYRRAIQIRKNE